MKLVILAIILAGVNGESIETTTIKFPRFHRPIHRGDPPSTTKNPLYPSLVQIPYGLSFSCLQRSPGYYEDSSPISRCQAYHLCMPDGRQFTMLCGIGTVFNQRTFVCDHWYSYNCSHAERDSVLNNEIWEEILLPASDKKYRDSTDTDAVDEELELGMDEVLK